MYSFQEVELERQFAEFEQQQKQTKQEMVQDKVNLLYCYHNIDYECGVSPTLSNYIRT